MEKLAEQPGEPHPATNARDATCPPTGAEGFSRSSQVNTHTVLEQLSANMAVAMADVLRSDSPAVRRMEENCATLEEAVALLRAQMANADTRSEAQAQDTAAHHSEQQALFERQGRLEALMDGITTAVHKWEADVGSLRERHNAAEDALRKVETRLERVEMAQEQLVGPDSVVVPPPLGELGHGVRVRARG